MRPQPQTGSYSVRYIYLFRPSFVFLSFLQVQYQLQPLTRLLPEHLHAAYRSASSFYSQAFGYNKDDLDLLTGSSEAITDVVSTH